MQQVLRGFQRRVSRMWARVLEAVQVHEARVSSRHAPPSPPDFPPPNKRLNNTVTSAEQRGLRALSPLEPPRAALPGSLT